MNSILIKFPFFLIRLSLYSLVLCTPILGVWLASSLVAYSNGPSFLAVLSGVLLFPLIPILWDLRRRSAAKTPGILTWGDRITLRTLALNLAFIICLLALRPQTAFLALSTRGDWMFDGQKSPTIELVRQNLFQLANGLEWLYKAVRDNPYRQYADSTTPKPTPDGQSSPSDQDSNSDEKPTIEKPAIAPQVAPKSQWPWTGMDLHPAVAKMPSSVETSIESVANYIAQQESDPFLRIKALHDYVADRIAYDAPALAAGRYPPQDAETVFKTRTGVCAGYAKLLEAMGRAIGEDIIYVVGDSRDRTGDISGGGHAWNGVKIAGNWYLIDATWDSGYVNGATFTKKYSNSYLLPPPESMVVSHFPDDAAWQLLDKPLSRGDFLRQPMMTAKFFADGLKLIYPVRSQTEIQGDASIQVVNPQKRWLMVSYGLKGSNQLQNCSNDMTQGTQFSCSLPSSGSYDVHLLSGDQQYGQYLQVGQVEFNKK
jgi:transglutaminase-like putative cysteine protease